jgi:diguanylate cyclase (GGDEF)-like protein
MMEPSKTMPQRILLIDDAKPIHALVRARLAGEAVEITSAYSGIEGLSLAAQLLPDLILLDVEMAQPDGFEVCRRLKADPHTVGIPIVFLTGASSSTEKILGLELGAVDYVTKPFDPAELRARVRASLRTKFLLDLLAKKAQIDGLTGLWNRAHFQARLSQEVSLARRVGRPLACVLLDIDHFKSINDRFGHPFGDEVLRALGSMLVEQCRREEVVCRYGGEEFVVLTPNTDSAGAASLAGRLCQAVRGLGLSHKGSLVNVTCSIGIAEIDLTAVMATANVDTLVEEALVAAADAALYAAKSAGRDRVEFAPRLMPKVA